PREPAPPARYRTPGIHLSREPEVRRVPEGTAVVFDRMTTGKVTLAALQQMKRDGRKIAAVVAYDYQIAQIVDRAGVDLVSVGDSVGVNLWGHRSQREVTLDQMT